jgi:hypothetical protein
MLFNLTEKREVFVVYVSQKTYSWLRKKRRVEKNERLIRLLQRIVEGYNIFGIVPRISFCVDVRVS